MTDIDETEDDEGAHGPCMHVLLVEESDQTRACVKPARWRGAGPPPDDAERWVPMSRPTWWRSCDEHRLATDVEITE